MIISIFSFTLLISLILISTIYLGALNSIKSVAKNLNSEMLNQINKNVTSQIRQYDRIIINMSFDEDIRKFFIKNDISMSGEDLIVTMNILNNSSQVKTSHLDIESIYIYSFKNKSLISDMIYELETFYDRDFVEYIGLGNTTGNMDVLYNQSRSMISIVRSLPVDSPKKMGLISINLKKDFLNEIVSDLKSENAGEIIIVSDNNEFISCPPKFISSNKFNIYDVVGKIKNDSGYYFDIINRKKNLVVYLLSDLLGWKYMYLMEDNDIAKYYGPLGKLTGLLTIVTAFITFVTVILISNMLYRPVKNLIEFVNGFYKKDKVFRGEFELVRNSYNGIIRSKNELSALIESNKPVLKERFIYNVITGVVDRENVYIEKSGYYGIEINFSYYNVIILEISQANTVNPDEESLLMMSDFIKCIIRQLKNENVFGKSNINYINLYLNRFLLLVNHEKQCETNNTRNHIKRIIDSNNENKYEIAMGIGNSYNKYFEIKKSYYESVNAFHLAKVLNPEAKITFISDVDNIRIEYYYPYKIEKQLLKSVRLKAKDLIDEIINNIVNDLKEHEVLRWDFIKDVFLQLNISVIKIIKELVKDQNIIFYERDAYYRIKTADNIEMLKQNLKLSCINTIEYLNKHYDVSNHKIVINVIEYIDNNYTKDLGILELAEKFFISPSHLTRIFKQYTHTTINEHINNIRINRAKIFLQKNPHMTVEKIATCVGYKSLQTFNRNFKIYHGMTPSEFRFNEKK
jgi:two-component system, response regulator YesN